MSHVSSHQPLLDKLDELQPEPIHEMSFAPTQMLAIDPPKKRRYNLEQWGNLSQDDAEAHKYVCTVVCHDDPGALRKFMLGKRLRKNLKGMQIKLGSLEPPSTAL